MGRCHDRGTRGEAESFPQREGQVNERQVGLHGLRSERGKERSLFIIKVLFKIKLGEFITNAKCCYCYIFLRDVLRLPLPPSDEVPQSLPALPCPARLCPLPGSCLHQHSSLGINYGTCTNLQNLHKQGTTWPSPDLFPISGSLWTPTIQK